MLLFDSTAALADSFRCNFLITTFNLLAKTDNSRWQLFVLRFLDSKPASSAANCVDEAVLAVATVVI